MNPQALVITFAAGALTTWVTGKIIKELKLPAYTAPLLGTAVGVVVNNAARRLQ